MPRDGNVSRLGKGPVLIEAIISPTRMGSQEIINPHRSTGYVEVRDTQIFNTSIDGNLAENGYSTPFFNKLIGR